MKTNTTSYSERNITMTTNLKLKNQALQKIVDLLTPLNEADRSSLVKSIIIYFDIDTKQTSSKEDKRTHLTSGSTSIGHGKDPVFSGHEDLSPKEFLIEKASQTDIERVACLAYYLTHYRDVQYFKTIDINSLNTEAAHRKLSNPTNTMNNAIKKGFLVPAPKKQKQLSALGEQYVNALPDQQAAKAVIAKQRPRHRKKKKKTAQYKRQG